MINVKNAILIFLVWKLFQGNSSKQIGKLRDTSFVPVYRELPSRTSAGKTNIAWSRGKIGVYIIKEDGVIVYVGQSGVNIYKTAIRHFQTWTDTQYDKRVTYVNRLKDHEYTIRIIEANERRIPKLEQALVRKYKPRDNANIFTDSDYSKDELKEVVQELKEAPVKEIEYDYPPEWDF